MFKREEARLSSSLLNIICRQIWYQPKSDDMDSAKKHKNHKPNKQFGARFIFVWILSIVWTLVWIVNYLHGSFLVNDFKRHAVFSVVCFCTRRKAMDNLLSTASISNKNQTIFEFSALHLANKRNQNVSRKSLTK